MRAGLCDPNKAHQEPFLRAQVLTDSTSMALLSLNCLGPNDTDAVGDDN